MELALFRVLASSHYLAVSAKAEMYFVHRAITAEPQAVERRIE